MTSYAEERMRPQCPSPCSSLFQNTYLERLVFWQGSCHAALWHRDLPEIFSFSCDLGISSDSIGSCRRRCPKCPRALLRSTAEFLTSPLRLLRSWEEEGEEVGPVPPGFPQPKHSAWLFCGQALVSPLPIFPRGARLWPPWGHSCKDCGHR